MPDHIKFLLRHAAMGGALALVFVGGLLMLNVANIWHLVTHTVEGPLALGVFTLLCWITFGSVQMGISIMRMAEDEDDDKGGPRAFEPVITPQARVIPVKVNPQDR